MDVALLEVTLEVDDGGALVATLTWIEVSFTGDAAALQIAARRFVRIQPLALN